MYQNLFFFFQKETRIIERQFVINFFSLNLNSWKYLNRINYLIIFFLDNRSSCRYVKHNMCWENIYLKTDLLVFNRHTQYLPFCSNQAHDIATELSFKFFSIIILSNTRHLYISFPLLLTQKKKGEETGIFIGFSFTSLASRN